MSAKVTDNSAIFRNAKDREAAAAPAAIGEEAAGNAIEELTNRDAVDTGRLRNPVIYTTKQHMEAKSISWHEGRSGEPAGSGSTAPKSTPEKETVNIGTNVEDAKYIEAGTSKSAPRPFLKPAATGHSEEYKRIVLQHLKNMVLSGIMLIDILSEVQDQQIKKLTKDMDCENE